MKQLAKALSDFPDYLALVSQISGKADAGHTHAWEDIEDKPTTVADSGLSDAVSTSALSTALASYATLGALGDALASYVLTADVGAVISANLDVFTGTSAITTLGTISTGTWQGTAIDDSYIANSAAWNQTVLDVSDLQTNALTASAIGATVQGYNANTTTLGNGTTGSGNIVRATSPTLTTPTLGVASLTSAAITGTGGNGFVSILSQSSAPTAPASGYAQYADSVGRFSWRRASDGFTRTFDSTLTANRVWTMPDADTRVPIISQTLTIAGMTGAGTVTFPANTFTAARTDAAQTFTGNQSFSGLLLATSTNAAQYSFTGNTNTGWGQAQSGDVTYYANGTRRFAFNVTTFRAQSNGLIAFANSTDPYGTTDVALGRDAAGVLQVNSSTAGTLRDVRMRDIFLRPSASLTPSANGELCVEVSSNTAGAIKYRGSDGVTRSFSITFT